VKNPFSRRDRSRPFEAAPQTEVDDELTYHVERRINDYIAQGMAPDAARAKALERFGDLGRVRTECAQLLKADRRAAGRRDWLGDLRQDLRYGARALLKSPLFTVLAIVTLALGIGANAAVFGVVKSVLLDALPYADADRLVRIYGRLLDGTQERGPLSAGTITDIRERQRSFQSLGAFMSLTNDAVHGGDDGPRATSVSWIEPNVLRTLGVSTAIGRPFQDDDVGDTARVVLVSHRAWVRLYGADPALLGRDILINALPRTVIGVLPGDFVGVAEGEEEAEFYFPLSIEPFLQNPINARRSHFLGLVGRLAPGMSHDAAERELVAIAADLAREYPEGNGSITVQTVPVREALIGDTRTPLLVLMGSAGLVLLIACANLAGALLSRTLSRRKEFAVRVAIGAGRGRLVRQVLTESTLLAVAGGAAGLLLATLILSGLRGLASTALPEYAELSLDPSVVALMAAVAIGTGLAFGIAPAMSVGRTDPQSTLRLESRGASESHRSRRLRGVLVAGQIALCISLLAGTGLLARSLWAIMESPLGFRPDGILTAQVNLPSASYGTQETLVQFQDAFAERLRGLPGVTEVASASQLPTLVSSRMGFTIEGAPPPPDDAQPFVLWASVSDEYFQTLAIPLRQGRLFGPQERLDVPVTVVISESFARRYWPDGNAVGARMRVGPNPNTPPWEIVGVVGDVRNDRTTLEAEPMMYSSNRQIPFPGSTYILKTAGDPSQLVRAVERELAAVDPGLPLDRAIPFVDILGERLAGRRLPVLLMFGFGALALVLSSVGVYALFAAMAAAREREFGVRIALGATRQGIAWLVLRQGGVWMALGLLGGTAGVLVVVKAVRGLLFGVPPFDPLSLGAAVAALVACGTIALMAPVRRAMRADPIEVMR
jgi:putative ABC transport system permease protein